MNEEVKNFDSNNKNDPAEEMHNIGMQSFTFMLPCIDDHVTIGWSLSNEKFRKYLTKGSFEEKL